MGKFDFLSSIFKNKSNSVALNYLWLNDKVFERTDDTEFGVAAFVMERAFESAKKYPHVQVNLWIDKRYLPESGSDTIKKIETLIRESGLKNLSLRDLCEDERIPKSSSYSYAQSPQLYAPQADGSQPSQSILSWRVDTAKLFILRTCLEEGYGTSVFSDGDIADPLLDDPELQAKIKKYGIVAGSPGSYPEIENQYIVFTKEHGECFDYKKTRLEIIEKILEKNFRKPMHDGFEEFRRILSGLHPEYPFARPPFLFNIGEYGHDVPQTDLFPGFISNSRPLTEDSLPPSPLSYDQCEFDN